MDIAFVLGNGTSRQHFDLETLRGKGNIYACNAVYRHFEPDVLIAVDPKMVHEIVSDGYHHNHVVWTNYNNGYKDYNNLNYLTINLPNLLAICSLCFLSTPKKGRLNVLWL